MADKFSASVFVAFYTIELTRKRDLHGEIFLFIIEKVLKKNNWRAKAHHRFPSKTAKQLLSLARVTKKSLFWPFQNLSKILEKLQIRVVRYFLKSWEVLSDNSEIRKNSFVIQRLEIPKMYADWEILFIKPFTMQKIEEDYRYSNYRMRFILIMRRVTLTSTNLSLQHVTPTRHFHTSLPAEGFFVSATRIRLFHTNPSIQSKSGSSTRFLHFCRNAWIPNVTLISLRQKSFI